VTALEAFEQTIRDDPTRGLIADHWLKKLESYDPANPEFYYRVVDTEWQVFRSGWMAAQAEFEKFNAL